MLPRDAYTLFVLVTMPVNRVARHARMKAQIDQHGHVSRPGQARYTRRGTQTLGHQGLCYHSMGGQVNEDRIHQIVALCGTSHSQPTTKSPSASRTRSPHWLPPQIQVSYCTGDFCFRCWPPLCSLNSGGKEIQSRYNQIHSSSTRTGGLERRRPLHQPYGRMFHLLQVCTLQRRASFSGALAKRTRDWVVARRVMEYCSLL